MNVLNEYAVSIIVVSLLAILLENLLPEGGSKKYVGILIGLLVMLVILKPLTKLPHYNATFAIPEMRLSEDDLSLSTHPYIAESFEKNLALAITEDIHKTYGSTVRCRVSCDLYEVGQITGICQITINPYSQTTATYISEKYGIEEAQITP